MPTNPKNREFLPSSKPTAGLLGWALILLFPTVGYPAHPTYTGSLQAMSYYLPLGINEQTARFSIRDSCSQWDACTTVALNSISNESDPGFGIRYSKTISSTWSYRFYWEYSRIHCLDMEFTYRISDIHECSLKWGSCLSHTGSLFSRQHFMGEQNILLIRNSAILCASYHFIPESGWKLDLQVLRSETNTDYLIGVTRTCRFWNQNFDIQWIWKGGNPSIYSNIQWYGEHLFTILHGIHTQNLGYSCGITVGYKLSRADSREQKALHR